MGIPRIIAERILRSQYVQEGVAQGVVYDVGNLAVRVNDTIEETKDHRNEG